MRCLTGCGGRVDTRFGGEWMLREERKGSGVEKVI